MLKTCSVCGKIHDFNKTCRRKTTKRLQKQISLERHLERHINGHKKASI